MKIKWWWDYLIFVMGIPILVRWHLLFSEVWWVINSHNWFEPISTHFGLGKPASCLTSLGESNSLCSLPECMLSLGSLWHVQPHLITPQPFGLEGYCRHGSGGWMGGRAGGRAGGCQTCGTHISVTAWRIFSIRSSMELSRPVVVHCHGNLPICPIWACPWAKNLSNLPQIGSRLCGTHISETAGWIYPI